MENFFNIQAIKLITDFPVLYIPMIMIGLVFIVNLEILFDLTWIILWDMLI
jgi:hypothetical protein